MKIKKYFTVFAGILALNNGYAENIESSSVAKTVKPSIAYVCGGNSGRSVMAEWYTRKNYGNLVVDFSRGSGIDPEDEFIPEEFAESIILAKHEATPEQLMLQRPTPMSIQDIKSATIVLTMTNTHKKRLIDLINRECAVANINSRDLSKDSKQQWLAMCQDKQQLMNKIYTLSECATGKYEEVPDAYGQNYQFYVDVQAKISSYVDIIMHNYQMNKDFCKITK